MSAVDQLTQKLSKLAATLDKEEQALLADILTRSAIYDEVVQSKEGTKHARLRTGSVSLEKVIATSVAITAKSLDKHGIKLLNKGELSSPKNLGEVMECWTTP